MKDQEDKLYSQVSFNKDFPAILSGTADELKKAGCGETEVRIALLSMCGVKIDPLSTSLLRIF